MMSKIYRKRKDVLSVVVEVGKVGFNPGHDDR